MITVIKSEERRQIGKGDQKTWMTFDSENESDPFHDGFSGLKLLNEENLSPGSGFIFHAPKDMIVITYVREGMVIYKGPLDMPDLMESHDFHLDNATPDVKQFAINVSKTETANVFQCGFAPSRCAETPEGNFSKPKGMKKLFTHAERRGVLKLIASEDGRDASLSIGQDAQMYSAYIHNGNHMIHELKPGRSAWLHVVKGELRVNRFHLCTGDGAGFVDERSASFTAQKPTELLLFNLCEQVSAKIKTASKSKLQAV